MYAVIATGGKQYRVQKDDVIDIERVSGDIGSKLTFDRVLLVGEGAEIECGTPLLESAKVDAEIVDQFRGKKLVVFKMKRRKGYRKKHGHRQELTKIRISTISKGGSKAAKAESAGKDKSEKETKKAAAAKTSEKAEAPKKTPAKKETQKAAE